MEEAASGELGGIRISGYNWADKVRTYRYRSIEISEHRWISYYGLGIVSLHEVPVFRTQVRCKSDWSGFEDGLREIT